ncbi:MAG: phosphatidylglycerophosphatase A [Candidatus Omnitrophota bacterium]
MERPHKFSHKFCNFFVKTISTFFGAGYLPFIPGTFGSAAGITLYFIVRQNILLYTCAIFVVTILGFLTAGKAAKVFNKRDPCCVVIDEVAGMLISLMFIPHDLKWVITGFLVFRLMDTLKPFPAARIERLHGSLGIMGDDIVAGIYTNIVLQLVLRLGLCAG